MKLTSSSARKAVSFNSAKLKLRPVKAGTKCLIDEYSGIDAFKGAQPVLWI